MDAADFGIAVMLNTKALQLFQSQLMKIACLVEMTPEAIVL